MTLHRELRPCELLQLEKFRRVRRNWRATLWTALQFLALSALAGYLWSCVKHAATVSWRTGSTRLPLAVISPMEGAGIVVCILALLVAWACRQQRREDAEQGNPYAGHWGHDGQAGRLSDKETGRQGDKETGRQGDLMRCIEGMPVREDGVRITLRTPPPADEFTVGPLESLAEDPIDERGAFDLLHAWAVEAEAALPAEIIKPAKHGFVIDLQDGERRAQVRVFEFERQEFSPGQFCEMPVTLSEREAVARMGEAQKALSAWQPGTANSEHETTDEGGSEA